MTGSAFAKRPKAQGRRPKAPLAWVVLTGLVVVVWNGIFDILVTRGVKEYLYRADEHELGRGMAVTMDQIMGRTVADASVTASLWALFVGVCGVTMLALERRGAHR